MKTWLKSKLPLPAKLALKRLLKPFRREATLPTWVFETPKLSSDGRVDFNEVERFLNSTVPPTRSSTVAIKTSIVIPVFNKAEFTFQCLRSLIAEIDFNETEIIVVNNASTDETAALLSHFANWVEVLDNPDNRGFGDASNQGAAWAHGQFLVFLNNDTIVLPGWLDTLVETVGRDEKIGVVGSLLLYPDGKVQEAGSIVWNTGEAFHYGWGGSLEDHRFTFARDVDYCSGASLLIRKALFDQLGGFDRRYAPAYYEDVDLCFSARAAGYRVVFQPASKIIHYEGVTAGRYVNSGVKQFQVINRQKFYDKWQDVLKLKHFQNEKRNIPKAAHRIPEEAVIVFDDRIPTPDLDAGSARMLLILKLLARHYRTVFVYQTKSPELRYEQALLNEGIETIDLIYYSRLLKLQSFHTAIVSRPEIAQSVFSSLRRLAPKMKIIFDTVDAHYRRLELEYQVTGDPAALRSAKHYRKIETDLVRESDLLWCTSPADEQSMIADVPGKPVAIVPTIHPLHERGAPFAQRNNLLFIGNFHHSPNRDAVEFFVEEILPLLRQSLPDFKLDVVGSNAPSEFQRFASSDIRIHGYVEDISALLNSSRVFVAPLRFGAGVKGKIGDALSYGLPVVTTDVGAEGMGFENGNQVMIVNSPGEFAAAVVSVYKNEKLWQRLSDAGYAHIEKYFSPKAVEKTIINSMASIPS